MCPFLNVPNQGHFLNLLPATSFFQLASQSVVLTTLVPFTYILSFALSTLISYWFHSRAGFATSVEQAIRSYKSPARCLGIFASGCFALSSTCISGPVK